MKTTIAAVTSVGLLFCACAGQGQVTVSPTDTPLATETLAPSHTPPPNLAPSTTPSVPESDGHAEPLSAVTPGEPFTYTLTVTNRGPSDATGVIVTDTLPPGVTFVSAIPSQGIGCRVGSGVSLPRLIVCELGDLGLGAGARITVVVMPVTVTRAISHTAIVAANETDTDLSDNTFYEEAAVEFDADLAIQAQTPGQVTAGGATAYTLTVYNRGPGPATGIVLTDVLPMGLIPVWTAPEQPLCGQEGRTVGCDLGYIEGSGAATVTLNLTVSETVALMSDPHLSGVHLNLSAPTCTIERARTPPRVVCHHERLQPGREAHLRIGVGVGVGLAGTLVHTATVGANETDADGSNNRIPIPLTVSAATPSDFDAVPTTPDLVLRADGPQRVIAGQPFTYTFTITNRGAADAAGVILKDDLAPGAVLSAVAPDVPLCDRRRDALTCYVRNPDGGETLTFTLAVTGNDGQRMSLEIDPLTPGWPVCALIKEANRIHTAECNLGTLAGGAATRVDLVVVAEGVLERTMSNTAAVRVSGSEQNVLNNTTTTTTSVQVVADLAMQSVVLSPAVAGKTLIYRLTVTNVGPSDTAGVVVADTLPLSTTLISAVASHGKGCQLESGDASPHTLVCDLGDLHSDGRATVTIVLAVDRSLAPELAETIAHAAHVTAEKTDPNPSNDEVTQFIPVSAEIDLSVRDE